MRSSSADISVATIKQRILDNLELGLARQPQHATTGDWYMALAMAVRGLLVSNWYRGTDVKSSDYHRVIAYMSAEFLLGPHLHNNLIYKSTCSLTSAGSAKNQLSARYSR